MLEKIKIMTGLKEIEISDDVLQLMIDDATDAVLNYCHRKELPKKLEWVVRELVINKIADDNEGNISSIKRGDMQITYAGPITPDSFTQKQIAGLNEFRKLRIG